LIERLKKMEEKQASQPPKPPGKEQGKPELKKVG